MEREFRFTCPLRNGLHARPASMLTEVVRRFGSTVTLSKEAGAASVDARSVLSIVGLDVKHGDSCRLVAAGSDAEDAVAALRSFVSGDMAVADDFPAPAAAAPGAAPSLPITIRRLGAPHASGRVVCGGIGVGCAVFVEGLALPPAWRDAKPGPLDAETAAVRNAIVEVHHDLERRAERATSKMESELLRAHSEIAHDSALRSEIDRFLRAGRTGPQAVVAAAEVFMDRLRRSESAYIRDRALDVEDVCQQLLERLTEGRIGTIDIALSAASVVFAPALTANQLLRMDRQLLRGLVLGPVGATSHTVILARSLQIPTLIDVALEAAAIAPVARPGTRVVVDGQTGHVIGAESSVVSRYYDRERAACERRLARLARAASGRATTVDGHALEIGANASTAPEVAAAMRAGADGVGLLRTEVLFLDRDAAPSEEEQFEVYAAVVREAAGRPVIIRTFDIGGDKPAPYLHLPHEENPFLGVRGFRLYDRHRPLLKAQLRAIVRASARGPVKVMAPMIATPTEMAWFRAEVVAVQDELRAHGIAFDQGMPIGTMLEIPAAALVIDQFAEHADFFSLGTNDLCQYFMAVDRGNRALATNQASATGEPLFSSRQPSFLRLLKTIVAGAKAANRWIGVCGEMASDRLHLPLMIGLGFDEISVAPGDVLPLKSALRRAEASSCRAVLDAAVACRRVAEVEELLARAAWQRPEATSVLDASLIEGGSDACSKEEAIKEAVDLLYIAGRTDRPRAVEEAVWAREETYSTGLGYGFAIPHCKTDALEAPALAVLTLRAPIEWGSMDGQPVRVVLLLAVPAADTAGTHMKIFATLARRLMHESFRERLLSANDANAVRECLESELGLA